MNASDYRLIIVGAGGLGREIHQAALETLAVSGGFVIGGFLDERPDALQGSQLAQVPILGAPLAYEPAGDERLLIAIGNAARRCELARQLGEKGVDFGTVATPTSRVTSAVSNIGAGTFIDHYALVSCDVTVGRHVYLGSHATVGHDTVIGDCCHIGSFSFIGGEVRIGRGVTIRSHATICPGAVLEDGATVGPNSVVLKRVREGQTVMGVPAFRVSG